MDRAILRVLSLSPRRINEKNGARKIVSSGLDQAGTGRSRKIWPGRSGLVARDQARWIPDARPDRLRVSENHYPARQRLDCEIPHDREGARLVTHQECLSRWRT